MKVAISDINRGFGNHLHTNREDMSKVNAKQLPSRLRRRTTMRVFDEKVATSLDR